jgi:CrcB protein
MSERGEWSRPVGLVGRGRRRNLHPWLLVTIALGGALGTALRYELTRAFATETDGVPWTTFAINVSGSFALGVLLTFVLERWPPTRHVRPFLAIGFLGAYTTFSTFAVESDLLVKRGHVGVAVVYDLVSLVVGVGAAYLGIVAGRAWPGIGRRAHEARRPR